MQTVIKYREFYIEKFLRKDPNGAPYWSYNLYGKLFDPKNASEALYNSDDLNYIQKLKSTWEAATADGWKDNQPSGDDQI